VSPQDLTDPSVAEPQSVPGPAQNALPPHTDEQAPPALAPEVRSRLLSQFERWLDNLAAGEPPPQGLPDEMLAELDAAGGNAPLSAPDTDLYTLFSALTTLSGEVRLQGRAFKQLADALAPLGDVPRRIQQLEGTQLASVEHIVHAIAQQSSAQPSALPPSKEVMAVLFDLYDRLDRGLGSFEEAMEDHAAPAQASWLARLFGHAPAPSLSPALEGLIEGYRLTLARLEGAMHQWGIERIGDAGQAFDPTRMTAIEAQTTQDQADGTVLEVYRSGYALHGQILATAQVKVAKAPAPQTQNQLE
jgi:hypothetical protein